MNLAKRNYVAFAMILIMALAVLTACSNGVNRPGASQAAPTPAATTPAPAPPELPQIDSSTARIPITAAIYELFTAQYGYTGPEPLASKTHGAWINLADGVADIVFLVAPTEDELGYFRENGVDIEMKIYGYDGLVFMGNESNPVNNLTTNEIRDIYSGKIKNWKAVGGENADILAYIRNAESGSQRLFESLVWDGYDMPDFSAMGFHEGEINPTVTQREAMVSFSVDDDMSTVTRRVLLNQYSIGFNIMSYIDSEFSDSELKLFSINGFAPTTENFASGDYPFLTTSYVAIRADAPQDSPARRLYDWVGSEESHALISQNSTLTVSFSESVFIRADDAPMENASIEDIILKLDKEIIRREEITHFTLEELGYIRNGVYALSGKIFKTKKYADYFGAQSWYRGTSDLDIEVSKRFNEYQKENLRILLEHEQTLEQAITQR